MTSAPLITHSARLDELIAPYADCFARPSDFDGYRNHCLRMLNSILALSEDEPDRVAKTEIALAFHDITVFPARTLDYLESSADLAEKHLRSIGHADWVEQVRLMIVMHHKITPYTGPHANLVEAMRKADWIDVSFCTLRFGLSREFIAARNAALPLGSFYPRALFPVIGAYMARHPLNPLPNFRW